MDMTMHVDIVSLEKKIFSGRAQAIFVTGKLGELGIYPGHAQLLSSLKPGQIRLQLGEQEEEIFFVTGGIIEVQPMVVTILADSVSRAQDLDEAAAKEAKERAERMLAGKRTEFEYSKAITELAEAVAQLRAIQKLRKKL